MTVSCQAERRGLVHILLSTLSVEPSHRLQARSHGAGDLIERLAGRQRVLDLQMRTADALDHMAQQSRDAGGDGGDAAESALELREMPQELAALYNDFAARYQVLIHI